MNAFEVVPPRPVRGGWSLRGYKGKGGGGGARQPVEAADSLHSTSYARVLDLLSEGEIAGLVNGLQSIYLNNTPLQNADGSFNFAGVTADFRAGFQTQDPIPGFPSAESPVAVGVELKAATPWVRSILNRNLSAVRVTLGVDGLSKANTENGDISGHTVEYAIDLQTDGGAWVQVLAAAFTGKTTQQYRRTHRIDLPAALSSWTLRVRRITPNANSNTVADTTVIESITEVIDAKLRYPMSALVGLQVDASQFRGSVPTRAYHCRGRIIRVPSNYDPVMRSYAGIWDGTFKSAYSNNPAWVFYDLATNDRYGLGKRIPAGWINKWSLYQIGVYCDGMVSNGRGGVEPRFTCNAYLQSRGDATRVLQDLCSIFRGMVYWAAGAAVPVADMPRDPAVTYNQADVIDGRFSYSGSRLKDRHTVALVSYNDMTDFGRQKVVYYQDDAAVARYGIRKVEISAFGCTSEAQALRVGQWAVLTAQRETRSVSFSLGLKGNLCSPGQVIEIADSAFAGRRMGGLVKSATAAKVALDAPVTAQAGDSITVMLPSGGAQSRRIAFLEMIGGTQHVSVNPAFDAAPVAESSWAISTADVATQLFTVLSVTEGTGPGLTFDVSAIQHEPGKFASIDQGALLPERPVSVVPAQVLPTPIGVTVGAHSVTAADGTVSTTVTAAWKAVAGAAFYDVEWSRSQSDWVRMPRTALTVLDIPNAYTGDYLVRVRAISAIDTVSAWGYSAATTVAAKALPPRNYDTFMVAEMPSGMRQYIFTYTTQRPPADLAGAEIRYILGSPVNIDWQQMRPLDDGGYYTNSFESTKPEAGLWTFALRARSRSGVLSEGMLIWRGQLLHNVADVVPDLTPPPAPTGVTAVPLMTSAQVNWASPTYTVGHGHDHSVIYAALWAAGGTAPAFSAAKSVGTEQGHPASIPVELGSKYTIWVTHVSVDGVESAPSVGITFETAQDVGKLLKVLAGKVGVEQFEPIVVEKIDQLDLIDFDRIGALNDFSLEQLESVAQVDLKRLDLIDVEGGPLGKSLVTAAAQQDALNQQVRGNMEDMAKGLLEAALAADAALERITDAGVYVDPATGQVKIYGLETTKTQVTNLEVLLDALSGQLQLKASTAYVDGRIAEAVLSPADLLLYEGLDARLINVVQQLDSINGTLSSKAEALELQNAVARLTTAESNLDAMGAQIALRVTRAEYEAAQDALQTRLGSAEMTLSALDVPAITATVTAVSKLQRESDKTAQALLQDILNGEYNRVQAQDALAFARNQLSASIQEGLAAEAAARTQLAATVDHQAAALELESVTRATADAAEASQRQALAATVQGNYQQTTAAIEAEQAARVDGDAAEAAQREALRAQMKGETDTLAALLEEEAMTRATADSAEATARQQLAAQLQQADSALGAQVTDERNARIAADEAEAAARTALAARLDGKDSDLAAQVTAEQSARVAGDAAEALARQQLATRLDGVDASLSSQITNEQSARSAGDAAEATARQQLAAAVEQAQSLLQAQITAEATARVDGDLAETSARESQISASRALSQKESERTAQALLQDILTGERNKEEAQATLALAKTELATQIQEGLSAEALQRTQLAAMVDGQKAALAEES
uniref:TipJ family phage tail tip protein n=1 Tax=Comamonas thiooxydans TaxID=363952 RepID=UPI0011857E0F